MQTPSFSEIVIRALPPEPFLLAFPVDIEALSPIRFAVVEEEWGFMAVRQHAFS